eukprot:jgi/Chlat1/5073/Chrsp33S05065
MAEAIVQDAGHSDSVQPAAIAGEREASNVLKFAPLQSAVDVQFWTELADTKLNSIGLDEQPQAITGFWRPNSRPEVAARLELHTQAMSQLANGPTGSFPACGRLLNFNTLERFREADRQKLLVEAALALQHDILSGAAEKQLSRLSPFLLITFADLKRWSFTYHFAFPAISLPRPATASAALRLSDTYSSEEVARIADVCTGWRSSRAEETIVNELAALSVEEDSARLQQPSHSDPCWLLLLPADGTATAVHLCEWPRVTQRAADKVLLVVADPFNVVTYPGWPLRNALALLALRWSVEQVRVLCYRETRGALDATRTSVLDVTLPILSNQVRKEPLQGIGWERNAQGKAVAKMLDLGPQLDPLQLADAAVDLNLKLMRWRLLPSLDTIKIRSTRCLLLGAGTLGCSVARVLLGWGVRTITFVDNGNVAFSNPVRQPLFEYEDCLNGGASKAHCAAEHLKRIFPGVTAEARRMSIPMPGHPVSQEQQAGILDAVTQLKELVSAHDVVFMLTDTRESRWLPTLLCADQCKLAINAALGFDTFLVMRHGAGVMAADAVGATSHERLGCYFCNDVVAPLNSTTDRTLDQQCTVTRPGLAPLASALAVELMVAILHHPQGMSAPADDAKQVGEPVSQPLGLLPHQIRGFLTHWSNLMVKGPAFDKCTACSSTVVSEYRQRGADFVLQVLKHPEYLEELTGLEALKSGVDEYLAEWDADDGDEVEL